MSKSVIRKCFWLFIWAVTALTIFPEQAAAQLNINLVAVNASDKESKDIEVKYHMPKELDPDDILDAGPLKIDYDVDKGQYFVIGTFKFKPKETKTYKIKVKDIWKITQQEIDVLKQQLNENLNLLEEDPIFEDATQAKDRIFEQLDFIMGQQASYSDNIERRVEEFRAYVNILEEIKSNVFDVDYLKDQAVVLQAREDAGKTITLNIEVQNPLKDKSKEVTHKHYLPEEVRAENVIDKKDFDVRYDEKKQRAYLSKVEEFKPGEVKRYQIVIKDIWNFPMAKVDNVESRADLAMKELEGSEFGESGRFLYDKIKENTEQIRISDETEYPIKQHIGVYRTNEKRYEEAKKDLERLEQMMAIVKAKKLEELEGSKVKNVLQRLKALRGLQQLSEALFKKGISVTMTWRIIFGAVIFVATFTTIHFFIWSKRSKSMGEELAPKDGEVKVVPKPGEEKKEEDD